MGLSQESFAEEAGLHRTYVSLLERGARNPSLNVIGAIAKALHIQISKLLAEAEAAERSNA